MVQSPPFEWLDPPPMGDRLKVVDVLPARSPAEHERLVHAWARDVWEAWTAHHDTVRGWVRYQPLVSEVSPWRRRSRIPSSASLAAIVRPQARKRNPERHK